MTAARRHDELVKALDHIGYELWMLAEVSVRLAANSETDQVVSNALLESMLIHARSLADFLIRNSLWESDLRRTDFTEAVWTPAPGDVVKRVDELIPAINKQVAHLTWDRVDQAKAWWHPTTIAEDLLAIATEWCKHLTHHNVELSNVFWVLLARAQLALSGGADEAHA